MGQVPGEQTKNPLITIDSSAALWWVTTTAQTANTLPGLPRFHQLTLRRWMGWSLKRRDWGPSRATACAHSCPLYKTYTVWNSERPEKKERKNVTKHMSPNREWKFFYSIQNSIFKYHITGREFAQTEFMSREEKVPFNNFHKQIYTASHTKRSCCTFHLGITQIVPTNLQKYLSFWMNDKTKF